MKRNRIMFGLVIGILLLAVFVLAGCERERVDVSTLPKIENSFGERKILFNNVIDDNGYFVIITEYTTDYDTKHWRITDSKNILMEAYLSNNMNATILVEHVHCDVSIKSTLASYDGWTQDSMDDSIHGSMQSGFWITDKYHYQNVFAIEGLTEKVLEGYMIGVYGFATGSWGQRTITESDFKEFGGVYAEKMQVVYDILVKYPEDELYHTYSFINEFLIPV